jgi:hypothetical protein
VAELERWSPEGFWWFKQDQEVHERLEAKLLPSRLRDCLTQLQHDVLLSRYFEEKSFKQIASALNKSVDVVKRVHNKALYMLRVWFKEQQQYPTPWPVSQHYDVKDRIVTVFCKRCGESLALSLHRVLDMEKDPFTGRHASEPGSPHFRLHGDGGLCRGVYGFDRFPTSELSS